MAGLEIVGLISACNAEFERSLNDWKQMRDNTAGEINEADEFPNAMIGVLQDSLKTATDNLKPDEFWFLMCLTLLRVIAFNNTVLDNDLQELGVSVRP